MHHITVGFRAEVPAVDLPRRHEIQLPGFYGESGEVHGMVPAPSGKKHQMVERVAMLLMDALVVLFKIRPQALCEEILMAVPIGDGADIVYRDGRFHDLTKVRRKGLRYFSHLGLLWYYLPEGKEST